MLFVFIISHKPWVGPIGITVQARLSPQLAQVLLISPAKIGKLDWQQLLQKGFQPSAQQRKPASHLGIRPVIWILRVFPSAAAENFMDAFIYFEMLAPMFW